jgi:ATP-dependent Lon protease
MVTSIVSTLTAVPIRKDVAMTGEITLRGRVLPIGGLKEKLLAAHRGGIRTVIIPKENESDLHDIPCCITNDLLLVMAETADEVLAAALTDNFRNRQAFVVTPAPVIAPCTNGVS